MVHMDGRDRSRRDIISCFRGHVDRSGDRPFVHLELQDARRTITFADAWQDITARQAELASAGIPNRGVVLICMPQGWEAVPYYLAAIAHGCIASFMPCPSPKQDADRYWASHVKLMDRIKPVALISNETYGPQIERNGLLAGGVRLHRGQSFIGGLPAGS